jgi:poly(3-hydroxybutyrate) depolymerase
MNSVRKIKPSNGQENTKRTASNAENRLTRSVTVITVSVLCTLLVCHHVNAQVTPALGQHAYTFEGTKQQLNYLLYLPGEYNRKPDVQWPLVLFFHGAGANFGTVDWLRSTGPAGRVEADPNFPFIVLSPHFPSVIADPILDIVSALVADEKVNMDPIRTTMETVVALLDDVNSTYRVDKARIYATGQSQGGYMTWFMAAEYPERFAAIAPVAGGGDPEMGCELAPVPAWSFHGALDPTIPLKEAEQMVNSIEACGGRVRLTVYPGTGHNVWDRTYSDPELYAWFTEKLIRPTVDLNGDGAVDIGDLLRLIESWGQDDPEVDIGPLPLSDGVVDAADLEVLMSHWGQDAHFLAHWKLDETGGDVAYDSINENHAAVMGDPAWQRESGQIDGTLRFDGIDDYLTAPFILDPVKQPFSAYCWVKGGQSGQTIISQQGAFGAWISVDATGTLATGLPFPLPAITSDVVITDGLWHRVGLVSDGSGMSLYVDDVEVTRSDISPILPTNGDMRIGASNNLEAGTFFSGLIDDVRVYDRVVTP